MINKIKHIVLIDRGEKNLWGKHIFNKYYVMENDDIYHVEIELTDVKEYSEVYDLIHRDSLLYSEIINELNKQENEA